MINSITTKYLPQTKIITKYAIDEDSVESLAIAAAATCDDAIRGLRGIGGAIYTYESAAITSKKTLKPNYKDELSAIPKDKSVQYDGEEWFSVDPGSCTPCLSNLQEEGSSLAWSVPVISEKETVKYVMAFREVALTFKRGNESKTKNIYLPINVPIQSWTETYSRCKTWVSSCDCSSVATCADFNEFNIGTASIAADPCPGVSIIVRSRHEYGERSSDGGLANVRAGNGIECEKYSCCAECSDFLNSFSTMEEALLFKDTNLPLYSIESRTYFKGDVSQELRSACEDISCFYLVEPATPPY